MLNKYFRLFLFLLLTFSSQSLFSQNIKFSDSFVVGQSYCPGNSQFDDWILFRAALDTSSNQFLKVVASGTYSTSNRECTDKYTVRKIAAALKSGSGGTYTCGGYSWYVGTPGSCYSGLCGVTANEVELSIDGSQCGCVTPGWTFRPAITNSNWGGINTGTCGGANQRMTLEFVKISKPNDMGVSGLNGLDICSSVQNVTSRISNFGTTLVDSFKVFWSVNGTLQAPLNIKSRLKSGGDTSIRIATNFNFANNTTYRFKLWTSAPNGKVDSVGLNDTLNYSINFLGNPTPPATTDFKQCGNGRPILSATPNVFSDSILWYDKSTGGSLIGIGRNIVGPYLTSTQTFYAQAMKFGGSVNMGPGFGGPNIWTADLSSYNGNMFDVSVSNSIVLDSITFELWQNTPNTGYSLYYKSGTFMGSESNSGAWTLISTGQGRYMNTGGNYLLRVPANSLLLQGGQTYGFYYTTDPGAGAGNDIYLGNGGSSQSNADISINAGTFIYGLFASNWTTTNLSGNFEMMYKKQCSNPSRTALTVTVKPRPTGADVVEGSPFDGTYQIGSIAQPDISEVGKTIVYQLVPPTGFTDAGHTSTWQITNLEARTRYGVIVPPSEYIPTLPSGGGPGTIEITPKSFYLDSLITFSMAYMDLGPHFCDSTIKRTMIVAPTPNPKFKLPSAICVGEAIPFDNLSEIHSGNMSFMWYFGDGDSSDLNSPVHEYKTAGTKTIRLIATSFPWGRVKDTTMVIQVGELPDVKFRVNNKCEGIAVTFQNQTTVGTGTLVYTWDFGDNTPTSSVVNPTHLYAAPKGYKVTLTASANGCISKLSKNAYMFARPDADFAAPLAPICAKSDVILPNTSTIASGNQGAFWTFGDGGSSTQFQGLYKYMAPGTYNVKLLAVSEFDCKDSISKPVTIKATPSPDFSGDLFCGNKSTKFTNTTNEVIPSPVYAWSFSDGYTSTFKNITRTWPYEGPFTGKLTATYSNGCTDFIEKEFTVLIQPKASFEVMDICSGEVAKFANTTKGDQSNIISSWEFGDGVTSTTWSPEKLYNPSATTTYTVSLVSSYNGGCKDTMRKSLTVSESPICNFTFESLGFRNTKFTPSNATYSKYTWLFGEGGGSEMASPIYKYSYSGNFSVTMRAMNSAGCECEVTKKVLSNTDIQDVSGNGNIQIYPNPNNGQFTVSNTENTEMKIEVFNVLGVKVVSLVTESNSSNINLEDQAKGIYLVKVTVNGVTSTHKISIN